ncbi:MAG: methyl-accepting chemotaxis protein [Rubrivivax sp.]
MNLFRSLRIGSRLGLGFFVPVLCLILSGWAGMQALAQLNQGIKTLYEDRVVPLRGLKVIADMYAVNVIDTVNKAHAGRVDVQQALGLVDEASATIQREWKAYMATYLTPEETTLAREAQALFAAADRDIARLQAALKQIEGSAEGRLQDFDGPLYDSIDPISEKIGELIELQLRVAKQVYGEAESRFDIILWLTLVLVACAVLVSVGLGVLVARSITGPIRQAGAVATSIASGDLTTQVDAQGRDEAADLLKALRSMNDSLARIVGAVRAGSDGVATGASQIAAGSADLSQRTEAQAANLEETAASMKELTATVQHNTDLSRRARDLAAGASEAAVRGGHTVSQVVTTMEAIAGSSRKISDIIGVIDGIAFQTNILALNAAVEAARAGEQGRGFAVVAAEVRTLAQRSAAAAKEIKDLITASVERVEAGSQQVADAGTSVGEIVTQVQRVTDLINEITAASDVQASGIRQVAQATEQLDQVTQQNAALVQESTAAAENLKAQAQALVAEVGVFKLGHRDAVVTPLRPLPRKAPPRQTRPASAPVAPPKPVTAAPAPRALGRGASTGAGPAASPRARPPARLAPPSPAPRADAGDDGEWTSF